MKVDSDFIKVINQFLGVNALIALKYNSINSIEDFIKLKEGEIKNLKKSSIKNISNSTVLDILNNRNNIIKAYYEDNDSWIAHTSKCPVCGGVTILVHPNLQGFEGHTMECVDCNYIDMSNLIDQNKIDNCMYDDE